MIKRAKAGRPKKPDDEKQGNFIQIRVDDETFAALNQYHEREGFAARTESVRRLLRQALKAEGLL